MNLSKKKVFMTIPDILYIVYPNYAVVDSIDNIIKNNDTIILNYNGDSNPSIIRELDTYLSYNLNDYIILVKNPSIADFVFEDRMSYVMFISEMKNLNVPKYFEKQINSISEDDFRAFLKMSFVLGKWDKSYLESKAKAYSLFDAFAEGQLVFLKKFFELERSFGTNILFTSLLTFFDKMDNFDGNKDTSDFYKKIIYKVKSQKYDIKSNIISLIKMSDKIPLESRIICFILGLRG